MAGFGRAIQFGGDAPEVAVGNPEVANRLGGRELPELFCRGRRETRKSVIRELPGNRERLSPDNAVQRQGWRGG